MQSILDIYRVYGNFTQSTRDIHGNVYSFCHVTISLTDGTKLVFKKRKTYGVMENLQSLFVDWFNLNFKTNLGHYSQIRRLVPNELNTDYVSTYKELTRLYKVRFDLFILADILLWDKCTQKLSKQQRATVKSDDVEVENIAGGWQISSVKTNKKLKVIYDYNEETRSRCRATWWHFIVSEI